MKVYMYLQYQDTHKNKNLIFYSFKVKKNVPPFLLGERGRWEEGGNYVIFDPYPKHIFLFKSPSPKMLQIPHTHTPQHSQGIH